MSSRWHNLPLARLSSTDDYLTRLLKRGNMGLVIECEAPTIISHKIDNDCCRCHRIYTEELVEWGGLHLPFRFTYSCQMKLHLQTNCNSWCTPPRSIASTEIKVGISINIILVHCLYQVYTVNIPCLHCVYIMYTLFMSCTYV